MGMGNATESPEVTEGACSGVGTEGLWRQYHGRGPHGDGSIALSQVVEVFSGLDVAWPHWGRQGASLSADSNANLTWKHPHKHI